MSGLCMAIQLKRAGFDSFVLFEKSNDVGGTWAANTYPNAGCDIPSFLYSFSFAPKHDWSQKYARQPEILEYFRHCAERFAILPHIRFGTAVNRAEFDEDTNTWSVTTADGETATFDVFASAVGQLSRPKIPDLSGMADYKGALFHSAQWNHEVDLTQKRVAVIGSGASAIQLLPEVAKKAASVTLFQRSPTWIAGLNNYRYPKWATWMFRQIPLAAKLHRLWIYLVCEASWAGFRKDTRFSKMYTSFFKGRLKRQVSGPLRQTLTADHAAGCKRILRSNDYYSTLQRENVEVVGSGVDRLTATGLGSGDREWNVDAIILATGFEASQFLVPMQVIGRAGCSLHDVWKTESDAYLGMMKPGFPNFFMLYGPNTNLGHNSIVFMAECQTRFIVNALRKMRQRGAQSIDVTPAAAAEFADMVQRRLQQTVWSGDCNSWYKTADGKMINNWCGTTIEYWLKTRRLNSKAIRFEFTDLE
jgi:cation diffusion facilitator CzcD-associated flavoprotein CzcO